MNTMSERKYHSRILAWLMALALSALAAGCGGGSASTAVVVPSATTKAITAFSFVGLPAAPGTINEAAKTIAVTVPSGTDVKALVAIFATTGSGVKVGATAQASAVTANDFTASVAYIVTAGDGTTATYAVSVTAASLTAKANTAFSFAGLAGAVGTINEAAKTITVTVPSGTDLKALIANFATTGTSVKVGTTVQTSGVTTNDFTNPVAFTVTAADGTTAVYTVTVTAATASDKAISAYSYSGFTGAAGIVDEVAKTIAVTVPSGTAVTALVATFTTTGTGVKIGATVQTSALTPNDFTAPVTYTVTAGDGTTAVYTVSVSVASAAAKASTAFSFAGITGSAGTIDEAAKTIAVTVPTGTAVTGLVATFATTGATAKVGSTIQTSGVTANDFTSPVAYTITAADGTTATYTVTVTVAPLTAKAITAYSFAGFTGAVGLINEAAKTVAVTVPAGTAVTALVATFTTTGTSVKVGAAVQTSTASANNFTSPVAYLVTAGDASTATYIVTVSVAPSTAKAISAYSFAGYTGAAGVITESAKTIAVTVPSGTAVTGLVATFITTGSGVKVGTAVQTSAATANNFSSPVAYIVSAGDGTTATYTVTVTLGAPVTVLPGAAGSAGAAVTNPTVISASPSNGDTNVPTKTHNGTTNLVTAKLVTATFSGPMNPTTITPVGTFTLKDTTLGIDVPGTVTMNAANTIATFTPTATALNASTNYTATITTAAKNTGSITAMPNPVSWSFTTMGASFANQGSPFVGQAPVDLLSAADFVILAKTTITDVPASAITGNIGVSPAAGTFVLVTCAEMTGTIYTVDATYVGAGTGVVTCVAPGPGANKTLVDNAIADMGTARAEVAARTLPDATELGAGNISGLTIYPGLYKWSTNVAINTDVTLDAKGDTNAVWIFQVALDLPVAAKGTLATGVKVVLAGGAKASNIFWQVGGLTGATLGTYSTFNGNILSAKQAIANTGAVVNGRLFADTQVTLQQNPVTKPAP